MAIPNNGLNDYSGPKLNLGASGPLLSAVYGIGNWTGYAHTGTVALSTTVTSNSAKFIAMSSQYLIADGTTVQGLFGVAYDPLASTSSSPKTVMDAWYQAGVLANNEIAFHACPLSLMSEAYIDFGNSDPSFTCNPDGTPNVWAYSPSADYYTINIVKINVGSNAVTLPQYFQQYTNGVGSLSWSIVDSCTTNLILPQNVVQALVNAIASSGAIPSSWPTNLKTQFLNAEVTVSNPGFKWSLFPTITFYIQYTSTSTQTFQIVLSAYQYIQATADGDYQFLVSVGSDAMAILGIPIFTGLDVVFDRANQRIGFALGCGCATSSVKYPNIIGTSGSAWNNVPGTNSDMKTMNPITIFTLMVSLFGKMHLEINIFQK